MSRSRLFEATLEEIKDEMGLKRRRSAEVLIQSALKKFKTRLAILQLMEDSDLDPDFMSPQDIENLSCQLADIRANNCLDIFLEKTLKVGEHGTEISW